MRHRRTVRAFAGIAGIAVLAALTAGCGGGDKSEKASADTLPSSSTAASPSTTESVGTMPDLSGLTEDEARAQLLDLGVDDADIVTAAQESLLDPGLVVGSVPGAGNAITGTITLKIAGPVGPVPDFAGQQVSDVQAWAEERGITFTEEAVPDAEKADGEVLSSTPSAGQEATSEIVVKVARTPSTKSVYLTEDLNGTYCNGDAGETFIDGDPYDGSYAQPEGDNCVFEFDLGRDWSRLTGIVGFTDTSDSGTRMRVQIKVDGTSKLNQVIDFGKKPLHLDVDVSGGLRLSIELSDVSGSGTVGFGDLQLVGAGKGADLGSTESAG
ncbi:hypothetical protein GCM10022237_29710 [Nocardioides ginsengisoli]|uniref:PASTA domain-containing protein n=1 Tax=Nocardioides ginsengisoli TaxID=363868 RepID=A0ABW3VV40_9ACTN